MSNRAATILAIAAVISSLCLYGSVAQVPERPRADTEGAIVVDQARAPAERPGRYQLAATSSSAGSVTVIVLDTHTGHCWSKSSGQSWYDAGSPVKQK
jgi:hypothetical protein